MGKTQKKTGKGRLDKYYKLAKEQGFRARSAFKLIQLNKKYNFLEPSRCCIDLCAAPGGWLQVASKYMPVNSLIVGVDLVPIKPIPRVSTFAADITTPHCRNLLRGELKDWKADIVLHDGAPNVGTAWVQDAYSQSELVLMSLKLAVEFLIKGGTFVTKVFRSADYNNLIWVFSQLFGKVEATKPPSSRNVSAEIFVVCQDFLAPKHIDPKFLDPKYAFKELSLTSSGLDKGSSMNTNVFMPEKKRRHRDGYAEGDYTLHKTTTVGEFINCQDPVIFLGCVNRIKFETEEEKRWAALDITTEDIKANLEDLKVLGKGDFKILMKWRTALREELGLDVKTIPTEELTETVEVVEEVDEEQAIQEELERLNSEAAAKAKREKRKANEAKTRTIQRMQLQMTAPLDIGLEQSDALLGGQDDIFDLQDAEKKIGRKKSVAKLVGELDDSSDSDDADAASVPEGLLDSEEDEERVAGLEAELDGLYDAYRERLSERDAKYKARQARKPHEKEEWTGFGSDNSDEDDEDKNDSEGGWDRMERAKYEEGSDISSDDESDEDSDIDSRKKPKSILRKRKLDDAVNPPTKKRLVSDLGTSESRSTKVWFDQDVFKDINIDDIEEDEEEEDDDEKDSSDSSEEDSSDLESVDEEQEQDDDDFEVVPQDNGNDDVEMWDAEGENEDEMKQAYILKNGLTTAEAVTLAQQLVNREKTKTQLINDGFNRYSLNSKEDLPSWFLDDESKHYKPNLPVTKEAIDILRAKQRALDARPIKKIAEAKARKKMKAVQKLQKAMKKAEGINDSTDMSEREKAQQIQKLMSKGLSKAKQKKAEVKVVVAKGAHKGLKGRPKGVKGRYRMVDSRGKKELRAQKRKEKANKKRR